MFLHEKNLCWAKELLNTWWSPHDDPSNGAIKQSLTSPNYYGSRGLASIQMDSIVLDGENLLLSIEWLKWWYEPLITIQVIISFNPHGAIPKWGRPHKKRHSAERDPFIYFVHMFRICHQTIGQKDWLSKLVKFYQQFDVMPIHNETVCQRSALQIACAIRSNWFIFPSVGLYTSRLSILQPLIESYDHAIIHVWPISSSPGHCTWVSTHKLDLWPTQYCSSISSVLVECLNYQPQWFCIKFKVLHTFQNM